MGVTRFVECCLQEARTFSATGLGACDRFPKSSVWLPALFGFLKAGPILALAVPHLCLFTTTKKKKKVEHKLIR